MSKDVVLQTFSEMKISVLLFSCVEKDKCNQNKVNRRSGGILGLEIAVADDAICPKTSEVCCANQEIVKECSDFSTDGFKCVNACFDMPQDFIPEGAKDAKCDQKGQTCCKRTKPPNEVTMPDAIDEEEVINLGESDFRFTFSIEKGFAKQTMNDSAYMRWRVRHYGIKDGVKF